MRESFDRYILELKKHPLDEQTEHTGRAALEGLLNAFAERAEMVACNAPSWSDLAERAEPIFLDETNEDDHTYQGRLFWPSAFRDEVLARLLALNAERHAEELRLGIAPGMNGKARDADEDGEEELDM